jgi:hypothetical protein
MSPLVRTVYANPSIILALILWGLAGFGFYPSMATFFVHIVLMPIAIALLIWLAHWEGRHQERQDRQMGGFGDD